MLKFIGGRILHTIPLIIAVTLVVFILVDAMPGDEMTAYINSLPEGSPRPTHEQYQQIRSVLELDKPWHQRYLDWLGDAAKGDFGTSLGVMLPSLFVGNIFVEAIFAWPGIGLEFLYAVYRRDGALITVIILFFSVASVASCSRPITKKQNIGLVGLITFSHYPFHDFWTDAFAT